MTLKEAIEHAEDVAQSNNCSCNEEHAQLAEWLKQLEDQLELEYRLLRNFINHMPKTYRKRNCNWVIVKEFLQRGTAFAGSTSSRKKCIFLGIDPDGYTLEREKLNENS